MEGPHAPQVGNSGPTPWEWTTRRGMETLVVRLRQTYPHTNNDAWMLTSHEAEKLKSVGKWDSRASDRGIASIHVRNQDRTPQLIVCFTNNTTENVMFQKKHNDYIAYVYAGPPTYITLEATQRAVF